MVVVEMYNFIREGERWREMERERGEGLKFLPLHLLKLCEYWLMLRTEDIVISQCRWANE